MGGERIFGIIIMVMCNVVCAGTFVGLGIYAKKRKTPMNFYSGTTVDPRTISDIPAYNQANSRMWIIYSIPFWVAAVVSFFHVGAGAIIMSLSCMPGFLFLIFRYKRICNQYMIR